MKAYCQTHDNEIKIIIRANKRRIKKGFPELGTAWEAEDKVWSRRRAVSPANDHLSVVCAKLVHRACAAGRESPKDGTTTVKNKRKRRHKNLPV